MSATLSYQLAAGEQLVCDHPYCHQALGAGDTAYPARLRENVYCSAVCRGRHAALMRQKARRDDPTTNRHDNNARTLRKYGLTQEEYDTLYDQQLGRCAICLVALAEVTLHVDHDHETNAVRGLLCHTCNCGIGFMQDSPEVLERAAQYLREAAACL